ncbi:Coenzyme F420 hydrogenase/dehydrogenase, beta subunit C-terminal domain [Coprobacillus cateniformis]|uniref:Coenzyme F420 hydrogenase/dehydrogenase, beta subunit C-terminal domain n=1 Tax=Coprobacillus cateniformis TaxID=100884 RepID=UPI00300FD965
MLRIESSSGGVFSLLAEYVLNKGGLVVGASWHTKSTVNHIIIDKIDNLHLLQKSKYVQSDTKNIYKSIKEQISIGKLILFSGTPCQVAALKIFLSANQLKNVILVDVICHGVPNDKVLSEHLNYLSKINNKCVEKIDFRYKEEKWNSFKVKVTFDDNSFKFYDTNTDPYFVAFNRNYILRESCYQCNYASMDRVSDITLGGFWNYFPLTYKMRKYGEGISCVMINTKIGENLFNEIKNDLIYEERDKVDVKNSNRSLEKSFDKNENYNIFWEKYLSRGYENAISVLDVGSIDNSFTPFFIKIKSIIKNHLYMFPKNVQNRLLKRK